MDTLDRSLVVSQELDASKKELEVAHASLTKECEHLENANKLIKSELASLKRSMINFGPLMRSLLALQVFQFVLKILLVLLTLPLSSTPR